MEVILDFFERYFRLSTMTFAWNDVLEIIIFASFIYHVILWIQRSRAWILLKGAVAILIVYLLAYVLQLNNLLFVFHYVTTYIVIGAIVILQPEIRKALEQLGKKMYLTGFPFLGESRDKNEDEFLEIRESIIKASYDLGRAKTGALIVIEKKILLNEYVSTGIALNADISAPLLAQIFEHNTPLHDGAIIIRGSKILAATCYLPLSDNMNISKELGTRHRAGLGISEISDSITVIVSEETGSVSVAKEGMLYRNLDPESLRMMLEVEQRKAPESRKWTLWKGKQNHEK
ncbi:MAG: diadenylate cyclase CdaA [Lachnospiraceae bacterium]|nr:diadenylate cyclase CdaA [Lachnospiraceae bacterium]